MWFALAWAWRWQCAVLFSGPRDDHIECSCTVSTYAANGEYHSHISASYLCVYINWMNMSYHEKYKTITKGFCLIFKFSHIQFFFFFRLFFTLLFPYSHYFILSSISPRTPFEISLVILLFTVESGLRG